MNYDFNEIEAKWQKYWADKKTFKATNPPLEGAALPKFYVLDMFPYPSGAGLHVGHPLGYIASDIYARYKRHKGFNVLHPMGYDSFGLPAEQYAIQTGQHPADTTKVNIEGGVDKEGKKIQGYRKQLDRMGFSFDWSREVRTSDPKYYKWTQWVFTQLFNSWYNTDVDKAADIEELTSIFEKEGNADVNAVCDDAIAEFSAEEWKNYSSKEQQEILLKYRLTYLAETEVNWCPALGTVLANDEIVNGVSERGGHPVTRKKMTQWSMRITAYAQRLIDGLKTIDWPQPLKDSQTNWIGRSEGATAEFKILPLAPSEGGGTSRNSRITGDSSIIGILLERAKEMRKNPTKAEAKLWEALRDKKTGFKFRRQHPIYKYIPDFVCLEKRLIIEIDGEIHQYQLDEDAERQLILEEKKGYHFLRFTNEQVLNDIDAIIDEISNKLKVLPSGEDLGGDFSISVFTTRPDTIFGVSFMTLAPEHELVSKITTSAQKAEIDAYIEATAKRSERERMADVKTISGAFTGAYAEHPFTKEPIPIWIGDYVLAGYGTGAVMSVPCGDQRDYDFAKHFSENQAMPAIPNIFEGIDISEEAFSDKDKTIITNSDFLNGLPYKKAVKRAIFELEELGQGEGKINYRLRDAVFSRQRYWGEPFPVYYDADGMPQMIALEHLPIALPKVEKYLPTETGEPPLGNATVWAWDTNKNQVVDNENISPLGGDREGVFPLELNTMPGWAGSSQYFNRYMDSQNEEEIFSQEAINYWQDVDLYIGGSEHATGHLLYSRFWQKFMFDKGLVPKDEYAKKLINQGMITGTSAFVYRRDVWYVRKVSKNHEKFDRINIGIDFISLKSANKSGDFYQDEEAEIEILARVYNALPPLHLLKLNDMFGENTFLTNELNPKSNQEIIDFLKGSIVFSVIPIHTDVSFVNASDELDIEAFNNWRPEYRDAIFILDNGEIYDANTSPEGRPGGAFTVSREVEKMSKSKYNVVSPDAICDQYGADSLRLYEMFLGPLEQSKPWNTAGITGVHGFLKKLWKLYHSGSNGEFFVNNSPPKEGSGEVFRTLHKTIKKVEEDIENFSFNTSVSTFMICVNELTVQKCTSREILEPLVILVSPYAPHIAEEIWQKLGHKESISKVPFPKFKKKYLVESEKEYPISFNGKMRFTMKLSLDLSKQDIEAAVMAHEKTQAQLQGRTPKKVIVVPGKIVNIVG
ncbi:Leucyl-tRNA synthetase [hydrothermal vent metagenome]|uniref:leucine--tRNA ligase n=1 Tax=hydrothermal vent metagenome TaxID=652676 RepID=A0A3B0TEK6_9ZZZZ